MKFVRRGFPFESNMMIITIVVWMYLLPLAGLLIVPFFGWKGGLIAEGILFVLALLLCWDLCGRQIFKR